MYPYTKEDYVHIIRRVADTDGLEIANAVNHRALEIRQISLDWFQAAAQELANIILNRD